MMPMTRAIQMGGCAGMCKEFPFLKFAKDKFVYAVILAQEDSQMFMLDCPIVRHWG